MRKQPEDAPSAPGGHAAERLREFLRERLPAGAPPEELNPELIKKNEQKDRGSDQKETKETADKPSKP
jgi:hypothetical protein